MTSAQVVETSVNVNNNSSFQNYTNPDDHTQQTRIFSISLKVRRKTEENRRKKEPIKWNWLMRKIQLQKAVIG